MRGKRISSPAKRYLFQATFLLFLFVFIFERFADEMIEQDLYQFDSGIIHWVQGSITPPLTGLMKFFTFLGSTTAMIFLVILTVAIMIWRKKRWEALFFVLATGGGALFNQLLKWIFQRQRPALHRIIEETGYSFPSGHSMVSFICYGMLWMFLFLFFRAVWPKVMLTLLAVALILLIGISRIYLGVHYPSDVLAGFAAGGAWLVICLMGLRLVLEYRRANPQEDPLPPVH